MITLTQSVIMMMDRLLFWAFKMITLVVLSFLEIELEDELSLLGFLSLQDNRDGLFCSQQILQELIIFTENHSKEVLLIEKNDSLLLKMLPNLLFLDLLVRAKNRVKSLMIELRSNSSCLLRERSLLSTLNTHYLLRELDSSQKLLPAIFRSRELSLEINSYLYLHKAKQEKKEKAYNNVYTPIGVASLISL